MKALKMLIVAIALLVTQNASAAVRQCKVLASGTYTTTSTPTGAAIPMTAKNVVYAVNVSAVSGTTPSLTIQYKHSLDNTNFVNTMSSGAITSASYVVNPYLASSIPQPAFVYQQAVLTISGTTPSFTLQAQVCYEL